MRPALSIAATLLPVLGCGNDDSSTASDAAPSTDAENGDASSPDAGPCGDDLLYQVEVFDWSTDISVPNSEQPAPTVTATEVGNASNTASVAPNGRVVLCLPRGTVSAVRFESSAHLPHIETVVPAAYEGYLQAEGAVAYRVYVLKSADVDALAGGAAEADKAHAFVNVQGDAAGFTVSLSSDSDAAVVGAPTIPFIEGGTTSGQSTWVAFRNVDPGNGTADISISGGLPCSAPQTLSVAADTTSSALAVCFVGP